MKGANDEMPELFRCESKGDTYEKLRQGLPHRGEHGTLQRISPNKESTLLMTFITLRIQSWYIRSTHQKEKIYSIFVKSRAGVSAQTRK